MLTKTLKFDADVLTVLQGMDWNENGLLGAITGGQLERKLYERVNKALEAMGGKWNRKAGGHVFATDPRPQVEGLLGSGAIAVQRDGFFETPPAVVERMLGLVPLSDHPLSYCLEPSAGMGAIVRVLLAKGVWPERIIAVEKNEARAKALAQLLPAGNVHCKDFLTPHVPFRYTYELLDRIYMNPPFENLQDVDHVMHAHDLLTPGGMLVSVMGEGAFFRNDRKAVAFREWFFLHGGESEKLPEGSFRESGTGVNARLVWMSE